MVGRPSRRAPSPRLHHRHARLRLELLEDRSLLATLGPVADHLLVTTRDGELQRVKIDEGVSLDDALAGYRASPDVAHVEADWIVSVALIPNDTRFGELYGLNNTGQSGGTADADIDAPEAWDVTTGSAATVVAVIDTGVDHTHNDLYLNIWINQAEIPASIRPNLQDFDGDGVITFYDLADPRNQGTGKVTDGDANGRIDARDILRSTSQGGWADGTSNNGDGYIDDLIGWDFVNNDNNPLDDNNHGTHVAGTIGAMGNNSLGVVGVNWKVQIAGLKFLGASGSGSISNAELALEYATAQGIKISNNSWGGGGFSTTFNQALDAARAAGHIFVAAAGNSANNNDSVASYPSSYPQNNVVAVAATDRNDALASFSSYGRTTVDIGAPGVAVLSTVRNNGYSSFNGTSMATPHVAGALALLKSQFPNDSYTTLIQRIYDAGDPVSSLATRTATGKRLNVGQALVGQPSAPAVLSAAPTSAAPISRVRVTFSEAIDPLSFTAADISLSGPAGSIAVNDPVAADATNTVFEFSFAAQSAAGTYTFSIGPAIDDAGGTPMAQAYQGSFSIAAPPAGFTYTSSPSQFIPDRSTINATLNVPDNFTITDLNVKLNITHTYDRDLTIRLRSPVGPNQTTITLVQRRGGSGDNFTNTVLDDEASTLIRNGVAPFTGSYRPEQALTAFDNKPSGGVWTLIITDNASQDVGVLNSWTLTFTGTLLAGGRAVAFEESAPSVVEVSAATSTSASEVASSSGDGGLSSLAVALGEAGEAAVAPASYTSRRDTREAAAAADTFLPRPQGRQELRDEVLRGLARRARPAAASWAPSWELGSEE